MTTASLENCKKLYELSGWGDTDKWYCLLNDHSDTPNYELEDSPIVADYIPNGNIPAYDLGFMLRKLDGSNWMIVVDYTDYLAPVIAGSSTESTHLWYARAGTQYRVSADNPTDAVALLAIKLFEQGVL